MKNEAEDREKINAQQYERKIGIMKLRERHKSISDLEMRSGIRKPMYNGKLGTSDSERMKFGFTKEKFYDDCNRIKTLKIPRNVN